MSPYYDEDGIVIYHGDCEVVVGTIDPTDINLVLADPPYGVRRHRMSAAGRRSRGLAHDLIYGDDKPFDPSHLLRFPRLVLFGANHYATRLPSSPGWLVWDKSVGLNTSDQSDAELAWTNVTGGVRVFRHLWKGVLRDSAVGRTPLHPTEKPVALMRWVLEHWTREGDLVLDPYMGSGPVAVACKEMRRRYIGIEIEEGYCRTAVDRLAQGVLPLVGGGS